MKTPRFHPKKLAIGFGSLAAVMLLIEQLWFPVFTVRIGESIAIPVWVLVAIYAGLQWWVHRITSRNLHLTAEELAKWGERLEAATPKILNEYEASTSIREIAADIEKSHGIPPDVTLRYIIALANHARGE